MVAHMMLLHRNDEQCREWYITPLDRVRWNVVGKVKKNTKVTEVADEVSEEVEGHGESA